MLQPYQLVKDLRTGVTSTAPSDVLDGVRGRVPVFVDGGYPAAAALIERLWRERMLTPVRPLRDPKTMLQEWAQGLGRPAPFMVGGSGALVR